MLEAANFVAEVAFFGERDLDEDSYPEELIFNAKDIAGLLSTLPLEPSKEVDLLE